MRVDAYVKSKVKHSPVADRLSRVFNNLSVAGILPAAQVTTASKAAIDTLLDRLERKLGKQVTAKKPAVRESTQEERDSSLTYTSSLRKRIDPATGEALSEIKLLGGVHALHNPSTRVVYPIPASGSVPAFV